MAGRTYHGKLSGIEWRNGQYSFKFDVLERDQPVPVVYRLDPNGEIIRILAEYNDYDDVNEFISDISGNVLFEKRGGELKFALEEMKQS